MPTTRRPDPAEERAALEARRLQAAELFAQGRFQAEVADQLGVSRQSAPVRHARFQQGGVDALRSRGPTGPDPRLSAAQLTKVEEALLAGAMANGFDTDLWTLEPVAVVICQQTGIRYHPGHVWVILRRRLGWSLQRPERRASERDEEAIARWVQQEWPRIKTGPPQHRPGLSSSTNRPVSLIPPVRRTWSPRGQTRSWGIGSGGRRPPWLARLAIGLTAPRPGGVFTSSSPATPPTASSGSWRAAGRLLCRPQDRAALGWAVGPLEHQAAGLAGQPARLAERGAAARLCPELNPVEGLWANLKDLELANLATTTLAEVADATEQGIQRVCKHDDLVAGFLAHTGLTLDP